MSKAHRANHRNKATGELLENREQVCPACFKNFGTTEAGDLHRTGSFGADRCCLSPTEVGLIGFANRFGAEVWRLPE